MTPQVESSVAGIATTPKLPGFGIARVKRGVIPRPARNETFSPSRARQEAVLNSRLLTGAAPSKCVNADRAEYTHRPP